MTDTLEQKVFFRRTRVGTVLMGAGSVGWHSRQAMPLDSNAIPEERFKLWLAEQELGSGRHHSCRNVQLPLKITATMLIFCVFTWIMTVWSLGAGVRELLQAG